mmetsp:Transcript_30739/g.82315  ORF Transcript_30739/g.82315 Transcript_30739/m.82315 type:complete len:107 (+) Transcript_30739:1140-1460(+)
MVTLTGNTSWLYSCSTASAFSMATRLQRHSKFIQTTWKATLLAANSDPWSVGIIHSLCTNCCKLNLLWALVLDVVLRRQIFIKHLFYLFVDEIALSRRACPISASL